MASMFLSLILFCLNFLNVLKCKDEHVLRTWMRQNDPKVASRYGRMNKNKRESSVNSLYLFQNLDK